MQGPLCIAVNQHGELCGLHKPGGLAIDFATIEQCTQVAIGRAKEITGRIMAELAADANKRQQARRNVHQLFGQADLLTVDGVAKTQSVGRGAARSAKPDTPLTVAEVPAAVAKPVSKKWKRRAHQAAAPADAAQAAQDGAASLEDDGRDLDAELAAVAAEAAELEAQLAAAESDELAAAAEAGLGTPELSEAALSEGSAGAAAEKGGGGVARKKRKKTRSK